MTRRLVSAFVVALVLSAAVSAQQVSESVNVMPVWVPCDPLSGVDCQNDPRWADAWRFGDIFLQRQVEPSIAPSSLNPSRLLTAFIDYSAVDTFSDVGLGDTVAANFWTRFVGTLAKLLHRSRGVDADDEESRPKAFAGSEAWVRLTWSTNGGATGTPFFVPGGPWDFSPAGLAAPYSQVATAASDPVLVAAPNGDFHLVYMAFKRGDTNWMMVARFRDLNVPDEPTRHGLSFLGYTTLASGNNATFGTLHDKPHAIVVLDPSSPVGYDLYVSYTLFNGNPGGSKFQSQLFVARSTDGGVSFTTDKINQSTNENSGTWLAATPDGQVYAFWRGFGSAPSIYMAKRIGSGNWSKPQSILGKAPYVPFDQGNIKVDSTSAAALQSSELNITPRSNAFPSAAALPGGALFVVFQECANPSTGAPLACASGGSPRVMFTASFDGGLSWSTRRALDNGVRTAEPDGQGYFWSVGRDNNNAHPQLMPSIACGAGQCMVTYWESRTAALTANALIGGYHRLMDLRGVAVKADGSLAGRSFQISRYPYRAGTTLLTVVNGIAQTRPETVNDIARVNEVVALDGTRSCTGPADSQPPLAGLESGCIPRLNFYCRPQSGGGTTCFMGDYNAVVPATSFVRGADGVWRLPSTVQDAPASGFLTASSDNRNLVPPAAPLPSKGGVAPADQLTRYTAWTHGTGGLPACEVGGSRNTDVLLAKVSVGLLVATPVTAKTTPSPGDEPFLTFPIQVSNNSGTAKVVTFTIDPPGSAASSGSFSKTNPLAKGGPNVGVVTINPFSSTTRIVYATTTTPVVVQVTDGTSTNTVTFNAAGASPSAGTAGASLFVSDPINISAENISAENISAENISAENISAENISAENISAENISAENISAENFGIQETTWVIRASGDPTKAYTALPNIDKAYSSDYDFHMVIYRLASVGACVDVNGKMSVQYQATVVANTGAENISAENISAENISAENGFPSDATNILNNSVFTPKPAPAPSGTAATAAALPAGGYRIGEGVEAQKPEPEFTVVKLFAIPKKPLGDIGSPYSAATNPASLTVSDYWCDANCTPVAAKGPDLVVGGALTVTATNVLAGQPIQIASYTVPNSGTLRAGPRRYGFYLSPSSTLALDPITGLVDLSRAVLLGSFDFTTPQTPTSPEDQIPAQTFAVPASLAGGTYYLYLYADDLRTVSELSEDNNVTPAVAVTIVVDRTPPVIDAHTNVSAEATGPQGAVVTFVPPSALDAVDGATAVTCQPASGSVFPLGTTTVTCSSSDRSGNTATSTFSVVVNDATPPVLVLPSPIVAATGPSGAVVTYVVSANDLVDGVRPVSCTPASGSLFAIGVTTVTCQASDTRGNNATGSFAVTVALRYGFIGVQNLPPPPGKAFNTGSSIPLRWQFTQNGIAVDSSKAAPKITIAGPSGTVVFTPQDPGKSSFQAPTLANGWTWQFNWQSVDNLTGAPLAAGTYTVTVTSKLSGQSFSGGQITLK